MAKELPKVYDPKEVESRIYEQWEESGCFRGHRDPKQEALHHRHAPTQRHRPAPHGPRHGRHPPGHPHPLQADAGVTLLCGFPALTTPKIATQIKVEEDLRVNEGKTRHDLGREKFLNESGLEGKSTATASSSSRRSYPPATGNAPAASPWTRAAQGRPRGSSPLYES